jgi:hypothetical protein
LRKELPVAGVIYKYLVPGVGSGPIEMPKGAHCLFAREQHNAAYIWALVDPDAEKEKRYFLAAETGAVIIPDDSRYLGTAMLEGGAYVLHIFEPSKREG